MISNDKITNIYYIVYEFFKEFDHVLKEYALQDPKIKSRKRKFAMSETEVMTIMILFHYGAFRNLKHFYQGYVQRHMKKEFPVTVSYNRFVELQKKVNIPMAVFVKMMCLGKCTGISFIDSTPIRACHIKREKQHKTFKNRAQKGQYSGMVLWI